MCSTQHVSLYPELLLLLAFREPGKNLRLICLQLGMSLQNGKGGGDVMWEAARSFYLRTLNLTCCRITEVGDS